MQTRINDATGIAMLTVGQFIETILRPVIREEIALATANNPAPSTNKRHVYGLKGLSRLLGCSKTKACKINTSGIIDAALTRLGNNLIYDADLVMELIQQHNDGKKARH